jgi:hypothetical protein
VQVSVPYEIGVVSLTSAFGLTGRWHSDPGMSYGRLGGRLGRHSRSLRPEMIGHPNEAKPGDFSEPVRNHSGKCITDELRMSCNRPTGLNPMAHALRRESLRVADLGDDFFPCEASITV